MIDLQPLQARKGNGKGIDGGEGGFDKGKSIKMLLVNRAWEGIRGRVFV